MIVVECAGISVDGSGCVCGDDDDDGDGGGAGGGTEPLARRNFGMIVAEQRISSIGFNKSA